MKKKILALTITVAMVLALVPLLPTPVASAAVVVVTNSVELRDALQGDTADEISMENNIILTHNVTLGKSHTINTNEFNLTISGTVKHDEFSRGLTKTGSGNLTIKGTLSLPLFGFLTVSAGNLIIDGGNVTIASGAWDVLTAAGTVEIINKSKVNITGNEGADLLRATGDVTITGSNVKLTDTLGNGLVTGGTLTVTNSTLTINEIKQGNGIHAHAGGDIIFNNSKIYVNSDYEAVANHPGGTLTINGGSGIIISGSTAVRTSGISVSDGTIVWKYPGKSTLAEPFNIESVWTFVATGTEDWLEAIEFGPPVEPVASTSPLSITGPTAMRVNVGYSARSTEQFTVVGGNVGTDNSHGGKITWNNATQKLDIAPGLPTGAYEVWLSVSNGVDRLWHKFTLTVTDVPQTGDETVISIPAVVALASSLLAMVILAPIILKKRSSVNGQI